MGLSSLIASASVGILIFLGVAVAARIYPGLEVPAQFTGALLGAMVTASITMLLLHGQSQAEEAKERNVKVFEEKTSRYNAFLAELWNVWEDRQVTLEELNRLTTLVLRDIIIYTHEKQTKGILKALDQIAGFAGKNVTNKEDQALIQGSIYDIINILSEEINLGGTLSGDIRIAVTQLESRVLPFLQAKELKRQFAAEICEGLAESELDLDFGEPFYKNIGSNEWLWIPIKDTPVSLVFGPTTRVADDKSEGGWAHNYAEFPGNPVYGPYRHKERGPRKVFLGPDAFFPAMPDFSRVESIEVWKSKIAAAQSENSPSPFRRFAVDRIEQFRVWRHDQTGLSFAEIAKLGSRQADASGPIAADVDPVTA